MTEDPVAEAEDIMPQAVPHSPCLGRLSFWDSYPTARGIPHMFSLPYRATSPLQREATNSLWLVSPTTQPQREPLRHILIGSPEGVKQTIHTLYALNYCEPGLWSRLLTIPENGVLITPEQGAVMSYLIHYRQRDYSDPI